MKKILLIFCLLSILTSCEIQYDGETKLVVTGKIIDQDGMPMANKDVKVVIDAYGGFLQGSNSDLISYGKADQDGKFRLIFPAPKGDYPFTISINNEVNPESEFQAKEIIARNKNFIDYKLNLDKITLYKKESITNLKLILNPIGTGKTIKDIKIEGKQPITIVNLNPEPDNSNYFDGFYSVIKNQTVLVKYTVIDFSNSTGPINRTDLIPINNDPVTYTINY